MRELYSTGLLTLFHHKVTLLIGPTEPPKNVKKKTYILNR